MVHELIDLLSGCPVVTFKARSLKDLPTAPPDGLALAITPPLSGTVTGADPEATGVQLARELREHGAEAILKPLRPASH
jgi:hypothetical protein